MSNLYNAITRFNIDFDIISITDEHFESISLFTCNQILRYQNQFIS